MSKRVSFNKKKEEEKSKIEEFDPDNIDIDLTRGGKPKWGSSAAQEKSELISILKPLEPSLALIPWHLPLILYSIMANDDLYQDTRITLQQGFYGLSVLSLIFSVLVQEKVKLDSHIKTSGPTGNEFLYTSLTFPLSILLSFPIYFTMVLLGAPLSGGLNALSFYLAAHVSVIAFFPLLNLYKLTGKNAKTQWWKLLTFQVPDWGFNQVYCITLGALIGCWMGVAPTPLDWDRDWQEWPITLLFGSYSGAFVGGVFSYLYAKFKSHSRSQHQQHGKLNK